MAQITAGLVKELRERTGAGMMDCKKALTETDGDIDKAIDFLREKGLAAAAKKAGRVAAEGLVYSYIHGGGRIGVLVEVNCETDFVAKTEQFQTLVKDVAMHIAAANPSYLTRDEVPTTELDHEKEVFQRVTEARAAAMGATSINDKVNAENALTSALSGLKVSLEAYPELKANQNFLQLQGEVADLENKLAAVRRFFNSATRELNNAVQTFPSNIFAKMFGFQKEPMFEVPQEDRAEMDKAPEIKF